MAGAHVVPGYLDGEGEAGTKVRVGGRVWHRTGDAGRLDAAGRLWLVGRAGRALAWAGGRIAYPLQLEALARAVAPGRPVAALAAPGGAALIVERPAASALIAAARAAGIGLATVRRLPLDRRHASKIDAPALARLVARGRVDWVLRPDDPGTAA